MTDTECSRPGTPDSRPTHGASSSAIWTTTGTWTPFSWGSIPAIGSCSTTAMGASQTAARGSVLRGVFTQPSETSTVTATSTRSSPTETLSRIRCGSTTERAYSPTAASRSETPPATARRWETWTATAISTLSRRTSISQMGSGSTTERACIQPVDKCSIPQIATKPFSATWTATAISTSASPVRGPTSGSTHRSSSLRHSTRWIRTTA